MGLDSAVARGGVLVVLGASGDLTRRLLMPALYNLACDDLLPEEFAVVGFARDAFTTEEFRNVQREAAAKFTTRETFDPDRWRWLESRLHYTPGEFDDPAAFTKLKRLVTEVAERAHAADNLVLYLAIAPQFFAPVNERLHAAGFTRWPGAKRLVVEKPFGRDLASATELNRALLARFSEDEIYRIDHYLGKETVQNLLALRLANGFFAPLWSAERIDHIQISAAETVGVETRGEYYDRSGAVRDMLQNHLLQVLAYVCMEPPESLEPTAVLREKTRFLRSVRLLDRADVERDTVRGQYGAGTKADGTLAAAYRDEPRVDPSSTTETYAALKLHLDNERWRGMPVYLRSGKSLWKRGTEIVVQFKPAASVPALERATADTIDPNLLVFHIQPFQGVELRMQAKRPGPRFELQRAGMRFDYSETFEAARGTGYEVLLYGALNGDPTLFAPTEFVETAWRIVQPVLDVWRETPPTEFPNYAAGTWGPRAANALLKRDGRHWHEILNRDVLLQGGLFHRAPPVLVNNLLLALRPLAVEAGATVVALGDPGREMYFVVRGELEAIGPSDRRIGVLREGEIFGEMALLFDRPRGATVRALRSCDLLVLDADDYRRIIRDFPEAEERLREIAAVRVKAVP